jgi:hypothetical protein
MMVVFLLLLGIKFLSEIGVDTVWITAIAKVKIQGPKIKTPKYDHLGDDTGSMESK